jgi:hypothetical protein
MVIFLGEGSDHHNCWKLRFNIQNKNPNGYTYFISNIAIC